MKVYYLIGYFVGNFLGIKDEWKIIKEDMVFLEKEQVLELFKEFDIIKFEEVEKEELTGLGKMKHWHLFNVIAKKNNFKIGHISTIFLFL